MDLKSYLKSLGTEQDRLDFAARCETSLGHLRNITNSTERSPKTCSVPLAVHIERESGGLVSRRDMRDDWAKCWPELAEATP